MTCFTTSWTALPSPYPELNCFSICVVPMQYVIVLDKQEHRASASAKQIGGGTKEVIGTFNDFDEARDACAAHWLRVTGGKNANG